jgi:hypothetical protein
VWLVEQGAFLVAHAGTVLISVSNSTKIRLPKSSDSPLDFIASLSCIAKQSPSSALSMVNSPQPPAACLSASSSQEQPTSYILSSRGTVWHLQHNHLGEASSLGAK